MADASRLDTAAHISPAFRDEFRSWAQLRAFVEERATTPAFNAERALHQLLSVDLAHRVIASADHGWILRGSLAMPARPPSDLGLPDHVRAVAQGTEIDPRHVMARPINDIDLCATQLPGSEASDQLEAAVRKVVDTGPEPRLDYGVGLSGLVHYSTDEIRRVGDGRVWARVVAQPIDPQRTSRPVPVDDPVTVNVDLSPPGAATFDGPPEPAHRSTLALDLPGFEHHYPDLYPTANQLADKLCAISVPYNTRQPPPEHHRYKDLLDIHYLTSTCRVDAGELRRAVDTNENLTRFGLTDLPTPYRLYGHEPAPGETRVPWRERYEQRRSAHAALLGYPEFDEAHAAAGAFADQSRVVGDDKVWVPAQGWTSRAADRLAARAERVRQQSQRIADAEHRQAAREQPEPLAELDERRRREHQETRDAHRSAGRDGPSRSR